MESNKKIIIYVLEIMAVLVFVLIFLPVQTYAITCQGSCCDSNYPYTYDQYGYCVQQTNYYSQLSINTNNATNITSYSATLNGSISNSNYYNNYNNYYSIYSNNYQTVWFAYGTSPNFGYTTPQTSISGIYNYNAQISGLTPNTTYYFRIMAQGSQGTIYGNTLSFNTVNNYVNIQPIATLSADNTSVDYNGATNIHWYTANATFCTASGGNNEWAGTKSIGSGTFYTGSLTSTKIYAIYCTGNGGSITDSITVTVRGQANQNPKPTPTSTVLITPSLDQNQPIAPTLDNTRPHPGDELNYTVSYQNIGTGSITDANLQINLPQEVSYIYSNGDVNPSMFGNSLTFNLGTLKANSQSLVTVRVLLRNDVSGGTYLNFPAILSYIDPSGYSKSVNANASAQVWNEPAVISTTPTTINTNNNSSSLGASVFGAGFLPTNIFGWLILIILILLLVLVIKYILNPTGQPLFPSRKKTTTTTITH